MNRPPKHPDAYDPRKHEQQCLAQNFEGWCCQLRDGHSGPHRICIEWINETARKGEK